MAAELRCMGDNARSQDAAASARFSQCWQALLLQHSRVRSDLDDLNRAMEIADPEWSGRYRSQAEAINDLYWDRMGLSGNVLTLSRTSQSGVMLRHVMVNVATDSRALADAVDKEASALEDLGSTLFTIAFNANEGPVDLGPFVTTPIID
jgi:hypothetical protein